MNNGLSFISFYFTFLFSFSFMSFILLFFIFGLRQKYNIVLWVVTYVTITVTQSCDTEKDIKDSKTNNII